MTTRGNLMLALVTGVALWTDAAIAQNTATIHSRSTLSVASSANMERIPPKTGLSASDVRFLREMSNVHRAEIKMGQLAQSRGGEWAQGYGKDMEREHNMALNSLKSLTSDLGVSVPGDVDSSSARMIRMMSSMRGSAFDNHYKQMMIQGHNQVLSDIQREIRYGHNEKVRDYAVMMETAVKLHLRMAREQTTMMGGANG